jgi:hypothetical protein
MQEKHQDKETVAKTEEMLDAEKQVRKRTCTLHFGSTTPESSYPVTVSVVLTSPSGQMPG